MIELSKKNSIVFPDSIKIATREKEYYFSMFLTKNETFKLMEQLVDLAMKRFAFWELCRYEAPAQSQC